MSYKSCRFINSCLFFDRPTLTKTLTGCDSIFEETSQRDFNQGSAGFSTYRDMFSSPVVCYGYFWNDNSPT